MDPYNPYHLFAQALRKYWRAYAIGALALLLTSFSEAMLPKYIQWAIDTATQKTAVGHVPEFLRQNDKHSTLNVLVGVFIISLLLGWVGRFTWRQILARQSHLSGHTLKTRIWNVLKDQPVSLTDRFSLGDLMNRSTADWNKTRFIHGFTMVITFDLVFFLTLSTISMLLIDWRTTLFCLCIFPFLPRPIIRISKREYTLHEYAQEQLSLLSDLISQSVSTIRMQRATASEHIWLLKLRLFADEYAKRQFKVLQASWRIFLLSALPTLFAYAVLFTYGIEQVYQGKLTIGAFIALQSYILLLQSPLSELGSNISEWQTGFASYKRITEIFRLESELPEKHSPQRNPSKAHIAQPLLEVRDLSYRYNGQREILKNISFDVQRGEKIGFVGPIGSGKTTLIQLIAGLQDISQGDVKLHGESVRDCHREWITSHIAMVPQKPFLFAGTIAHNLSPGASARHEELIAVLRCVELWDDVLKLPKGLESWVGEWGINLSGGQKQRLSLARALLKPADIYLFDDCLSAVDSLTEQLILSNLQSFLSGKSVLWTAHRHSTLHICERIFEIDQGRLLALNPAQNARVQIKDALNPSNRDENAEIFGTENASRRSISVMGETS